MKNFNIFKQTTGGFISFLITVMTCGLIAAMPMTAWAQSTLTATIDVSLLDNTHATNGIDEASAPASWWQYNKDSRILHLCTFNGNYILQGNNSNLQVRVDYFIGDGAHVILDGANIENPDNDVFVVTGDATIELVGTNNSLIATGSYNKGLTLISRGAGNSLEINSSSNGTLYVVGVREGIYLDYLAMLTISGTAKVTAESSNNCGILSQASKLINVEEYAELNAIGGNGYGLGGYNADLTLNCRGKANFTGIDAGIYMDANRTLALRGTGTGEIKATGDDYGIEIASGSGLAIYDDVKVTAKGIGNSGILAWGKNVIEVGTDAKLDAIGDIFGLQACELTLHCDGEATFIGTTDYGINMNPGYSLFIQGAGDVTAQGIGGINVNSYNALTLQGTGAVMAIGTGSFAVNTTNPVDMRPDAKLTMTNNSVSAEIHEFKKFGIGSNNKWKLTGSATTTDILLTNTSISVTVAAGGIPGTVEREASDNASLISVAGQAIMAGSETGIITDPKTASITVPNSKASITVADIVAAAGATKVIFGDSLFLSSLATSPLSVGTNHVYIAIVAEDGLAYLYYNVTVTRQAIPPVAPAISGPTTMELTVGYAATSTSAFSISGTAPVTVRKFSGDGNITWNSSTKKLDIAAGLPAGKYEVKLQVYNNVSSAMFTFTLTVKTKEQKEEEEKENEVFFIDAPQTTTGGNVQLITQTPYLALAGETVTLLITPDNGYDVASVTVYNLNDHSVTIPVYDSDNNTIVVRSGSPTRTFTFTMPAHHIHIEVVFRNTSVGNEQLTMNNEQLKAWTQDGVLYVNGLIAGCTWRVYNITGTLIYQGVADAAEAAVPLPGRGMYIIQSGNAVVKITN